MKHSIEQLKQRRQRKEKFTVVAAYDASFTGALNEAGIEVILVGDSLGMVVQGHDSTLPVSIEAMAYHTAAVERRNRDSAQQALIIADMPFMSYADSHSALENAAELMRAGANMVKLEGGVHIADTVEKLVQCGIPVCGHLGLTPQSVNTLGGYKVQGRSEQQQQQLLADAAAIERAGADFIVLECIPSTLAAAATEALDCATIGIGAGGQTDAQVLVCYDMLGMTDNPARFVKNFLGAAEQASEKPIQQAFAAFKQAVENGHYPGEEHQYS